MTKKLIASVSLKANTVVPCGPMTIRWTPAIVKLPEIVPVAVLMLWTVPSPTATHPVLPSGVIATSNGRPDKGTVNRIVSEALSKIVTEVLSVLWINVVPPALTILPGEDTLRVCVITSVLAFTTLMVPELLSDISIRALGVGVGVPPPPNVLIPFEHPLANRPTKTRILGSNKPAAELLPL